MSKMLARATVASLVAAALLTASRPARAQTFDTLGTRAAGMGGAFVAVADDATAVYWNPAGLALGGTLFSFVVETGQASAEPDDSRSGARRSASFVGLTTPPLGLSYYRLSNTTVRPPASGVLTSPAVDLRRLVTQHAGATIVQSLTAHIAVAATVKFVHGVASSGVILTGNRDDLLDDGGGLPETSSNKFDADIGVLASYGTWRGGLTIRNVTQPDFEVAGSTPIELKRQTRAGVAFLGVPLLIVSADLDLERAEGSLGDVRDLAAGAEAHLFPRLYVRSGFRFNTLADEPGGRAPVWSLGAGLVTFRSLVVDAQVTMGSDSGNHGWSIGGHLAY